jgi:non-ribosomal peptide synthetase component F
MAIEMTGGVYCPLSPADPQHRLHAFVQQTQCRVVFVHHFTKVKFDNDIMSVDIDTILPEGTAQKDVDIDRLSSVMVTSNNICYIILTSGSTGTPKAVGFLHCSKYIFRFFPL